MLALKVVPEVYYFDKFEEFQREFKIGERDLLVTNEWIYEPIVKPLGITTNIIYQEDFGSGEPSDEMIDALAAESQKYNFERVIALGGGTIVDICKIIALKVPQKSIDLFTDQIPLVKEKKLIVIPTTCGTGSEVTNISVAELKSLQVKKGLASPETFADAAVLIPETMKGLPYKFFITSSVDALIHAVESYLSPKATPYTEVFSLNAAGMIMSGYKKIIEFGEHERFKYMKEFALASNYAGIAFGNAGCGAVHALSYSIGGAFHVAHGEANYQFFTEVLKKYAEKNPSGKISAITDMLAEILDIDKKGDVYGALDGFLGKLIEKKPLKAYGMREEQIIDFTNSTIENQQRLLANNYVPLREDDFKEIFTNLF